MASIILKWVVALLTLIIKAIFIMMKEHLKAALVTFILGIECSPGKEDLFSEQLSFPSLIKMALFLTMLVFLLVINSIQIKKLNKIIL